MKPTSTFILEKPYIAINATALFKKHKTGVEWYVWQLSKHLAQEWKESDLPVVLLAPARARHATFEHVGGRFLKNANWYLKLLKGKYFWTQYHLLKFLKRYPPALLFSPSYVPPLFLPHNIPTLTVVHGLEGEYFPEFKTVGQIISEHIFVIPALRRDTLHRDRRNIPTIIAVSEHTKKDLNYFYDISLDKIKPILSGPGTLDDQNSHVQNPYVEAGIKPAPTEKNIRFLFLGGSDERKNLELAIGIFLKLRVETQNFASLHIAGNIINGNINNFIKNRKKNIFKLGYISEEKKIEYLKSADFLLYPSFYEGFGFPVLEAQANGAVPIVLKGSGLNEVGGKGIIEFDVERGKESIARIIDFAKNRNKYRQLQKSGLENVQKYSWQTCAKEVRKILLKIIHNL